MECRISECRRGSAVSIIYIIINHDRHWDFNRVLTRLNPVVTFQILNFPAAQFGPLSEGVLEAAQPMCSIGSHAAGPLSEGVLEAALERTVQQQLSDVSSINSSPAQDGTTCRLNEMDSPDASSALGRNQGASKWERRFVQMVSSYPFTFIFSDGAKVTRCECQGNTNVSLWKWCRISSAPLLAAKSARVQRSPLPCVASICGVVCDCVPSDSFLLNSSMTASIPGEQLLQ